MPEFRDLTTGAAAPSPIAADAPPAPELHVAPDTPAVADSAMVPVPYAPQPLHLDAVIARLREVAALPLVRGGALALVAIAAGLFWYQAGVHAPDGTARAAAIGTRGVRRRTAAAPAVENASVPGPATGSDLLVHVSGAVQRPGLYHLAGGSRVADAVTAAGGATADADPNRLNLAARITDGQHIIVPKRGEPLPEESGAEGGAARGAQSRAGPVSLNTASEAELETLPRIGPALARAIIDYRQRRGGFRNVHDLRNVHGIGERVYADLVDLVTL